MNVSALLGQRKESDVYHLAWHHGARTRAVRNPWDGRLPLPRCYYGIVCGRLSRWGKMASLCNAALLSTAGLEGFRQNRAPNRL